MLSVFSRLTRKRKRDDHSDEQQHKAKKAKKVFDSYSNIGYKEDKFHAVFKTIPRSLEGASDLISRCVVAFLNTGGGILSFGVSPSGTVYGEKINRKEEDNLKLAIDEVFKKIHPMVKPGMYRVTFTPVVDRGKETSLSVLEIRVQKGDMFQLYETGMLAYKTGYLGKRDSQVFVREGSTVSEPLRTHAIKEIAIRLLKEKLKHQATLTEKLKSTVSSKTSCPTKTSSGNNTKTTAPAKTSQASDKLGYKPPPKDNMLSKEHPDNNKPPSKTVKLPEEQPSAGKSNTSVESKSSENTAKPKSSTETPVNTPENTSKISTLGPDAVGKKEVIVISSSEDSPVMESAKPTRAPLKEANKKQDSGPDKIIYISSSDECPIPKENRAEPPKKKLTKKISTLVTSIRKSVKKTFSSKPSNQSQPRKSSLPTIRENVVPRSVQRSASVSYNRKREEQPNSAYYQSLPPRNFQPAKPVPLMSLPIHPPAYFPPPSNMPPPLVPPPPSNIQPPPLFPPNSVLPPPSHQYQNYGGHGYWSNGYHSRYAWN